MGEWAQIRKPQNRSDGPKGMETSITLADCIVMTGRFVGAGRQCPASQKTVTTVRLDQDVVQACRETGEEWRTRINADLGRAQAQRSPEK